MNMNGTPSYSQMGTPSSFSNPSMMGMTPSMMDGRSPHFVRGRAAYGKQIVTAPDVSKLGEDLSLRASSADSELKQRLRAEQFGASLLYVVVLGAYVRGRGWYCLLCSSNRCLPSCRTVFSSFWLEDSSYAPINRCIELWLRSWGYVSFTVGITFSRRCIRSSSGLDLLAGVQSDAPWHGNTDTLMVYINSLWDCSCVCVM
jgi:hypothetical protein